MSTVLLYISVTLILLSMAMLLFTRSLFKMALGLVFALIGVAVLYASIGAYWPMTVQLMLYVGGVVVLILFTIMVVGEDIEKSNKVNLTSSISPMGTKFSYAIGFLVSGLTGYFLYKLQMGAKEILRFTSNSISILPEEFGNKLMNEHFLSFELASILLLVAMLGGAVIARPVLERRKK